VGQVLAEAECFAIAAQIDSPAAVRPGQAEEEARDAEARLVHIGGDQDSRGVALKQQSRQHARGVAAEFASIEPIELGMSKVARYRVGDVVPRCLTQRNNQELFH
jgi:hypothetical protein